MPPELKRPITNMDEMTCENCVFSYAYYTHKGKYPVCFNPESPDWERENEGVCSKGQWLWFGKWLYEEHTSDSKEILHLCNYWELYTKFARDAGQKKVGV